MPLTAEQRAAIRRRIQSQFGAPDVRHESESTSSLAPPGYNRKSFQPDRRSVDHLDPPAIDAPASDPEPTLTHEVDPIDDPPRRKCMRTETHRPLLCDQFPGRRFAITEAADEANVPTLLIFAAVKDGGRKPVGRKKLVFFHEDSVKSDEVEMDSPQASQQEETAKEAESVPAYISEKPDNGRVPVDPEKFNEALELLKQGIPNSEVAQKTGLHHSTVRKIVRDEIWAKKSPKPAADKRNGHKPKAMKSRDDRDDRDDYCLVAERRAAQQKLNEEILAVQKKYDEIFRAIETVEKLMAERAMAKD